MSLFNKQKQVNCVTEYLHFYGIWWKNVAYKIYACKRLLCLLLIESCRLGQGNVLSEKNEQNKTLLMSTQDHSVY